MMKLVTLVNMPIRMSEDGGVTATGNIYARYPGLEDVAYREYERGERVGINMEKLRYKIQQNWLFTDGGGK